MNKYKNERWLLFTWSPELPFLVILQFQDSICPQPLGVKIRRSIYSMYTWHFLATALLIAACLGGKSEIKSVKPREDSLEQTSRKGERAARNSCECTCRRNSKREARDCKLKPRCKVSRCHWKSRRGYRGHRGLQSHRGHTSQPGFACKPTCRPPGSPTVVPQRSPSSSGLVNSPPSQFFRCASSFGLPGAYYVASTGKVYNVYPLAPRQKIIDCLNENLDLSKVRLDRCPGDSFKFDEKVDKQVCPYRFEFCDIHLWAIVKLFSTKCRWGPIFFLSLQSIFLQDDFS